MNFKSDVKKELKSKTFWIAVAIAIPLPFSLVFKELQFVQDFYGMFMFSAIPLAAVVSYSHKFASWFVGFHKRFYGKTGQYSKLPQDLKFSILKSSSRTVIYIFAIVYTVLDWSGANEFVFRNPTGLIAIMLIAFMAIIPASIMEISPYLLKRYGLMFENGKDGTKINLGGELQRRLEFIISPIALISFAHAIFIKSSNIESVLVMIFVLVVLSFYSTIVSFFLLRRKNNLNRLMDKLELLLNRNG